MNARSYTTTIFVDATPERIFNAINDVRGWWSHDVEGNTDQTGEEFTFRGRNIHYSKIKVTELVPGQKIEWLVLDNYMNFIQDQSEWKDTRILFEISQDSDRAKVRFSHIGLVPAYECFDVCSNAWAFFIHDSLRNLITTGEGQPMLLSTPADS